jgi:hypothetical protein
MTRTNAGNHQISATDQKKDGTTMPDHQRQKKKAGDTGVSHGMQEPAKNAVFTDSLALVVFNRVLSKKKEWNDEEKRSSGVLPEPII